MAVRVCSEALLLLLLAPQLTVLQDMEPLGSGDETRRAEPGEAGLRAVRCSWWFGCGAGGDAHRAVTP